MVWLAVTFPFEKVNWLIAPGWVVITVVVVEPVPLTVKPCCILAMACWVASSARPEAAFWREKFLAAICSTREVERKETTIVARSAVMRRVRMRAEPEEEETGDRKADTGNTEDNPLMARMDANRERLGAGLLDFIVRGGCYWLLKGMKRLMVTEPWEMRRSTVVKLDGGEEERPLLICRSVKGVPAFIAAIFSAVLESRTEMVTRTPSGRRSWGGQVEDQPGVPVGEVGLP